LLSASKTDISSVFNEEKCLHRGLSFLKDDMFPFAHISINLNQLITILFLSFTLYWLRHVLPSLLGKPGIINDSSLDMILIFLCMYDWSQWDHLFYSVWHGSMIIPRNAFNYLRKGYNTYILMFVLH